MDLRHLRYFVTLADELHFGRAAQRLHITQSPLSVGIRQLEDELQFRLFERDSRQVTLTPAGRAFLRTAIDLLRHAENAVDFGRALAAGQAGHLHIGFASAMVFRGLPSMLAAFEQRHPDVRITLHEASSLELTQLVDGGRLDAGFINVSDPEQALQARELQHQVVCREPYVACLPHDHPLAGAPSMALAALRDEPFIVFAREVSPGHHAHLAALCAAAGFHPRSRLQVRQFLSMVALVAAGMGVAVVPASIARSAMPGASFVALAGSEPQPTAHLIWNPAREAPGLAGFVELVTAIAARSTH